ncbi:MAG: hypothetical protein M1144_06235 [Candidatus Thermoplasmatota archaeon]|nr:hypothetical protein [Candidatus Thermoplasmatota archaeon]
MSSRVLTLSTNAVRVGSSLLSAGLVPGEERIRSSGLPRSSYRFARRRLYESGLFQDHYIPSPRAMHTPRIFALLLHPFTDSMVRVCRELRQCPGATTVVPGGQSIFALIWPSSTSEAEKIVKKVSDGDWGTPLSNLSIDPHHPQVPVYFDFEGAWSRFAGTGGTVRYPRKFPEGESLGTWGRLAGNGVRAFQQLLGRPYESSDASVPKHLSGPDSLPRSQRRLLEQGLVDWRVLLNPEVMPEFEGVSISQLIWTRGSLKLPGDLGPLFRSLTSECGVYPFLLASDGDQVLMGNMGIGRDRLGGAPPRIRPKTPVLPVVARYLHGLEVIREPLASVTAHLWQRYDRLTGLGSPDTAGTP